MIGIMEELLEVFDLQDRNIGVMERQAFYKEIEREWKARGNTSKKVRQMRLVLMNTDGKIYLQKRSSKKEQNGGLYDKTVGGHVRQGYTVNITLVQECAEELGFPATVLNDDEFLHAIRNVDLHVIGIFRKVDDVKEYESVRVTPRGSFTMKSICAFFIGYYDGSIRFADAEASGIEVFDLPDLRAEIAHHPEKFTEDLKYFVEQYAQYLVPVSALLEQQEQNIL